NTVRAGADGVWGLLLLVLKVLGTVVLIGVTTGAIFACIFILYINTNIMGSTKLEVSLENVKLDLSSAIYAKNSQTGLWEEVVTLESGTNRVWLDYEELPLDLEHAVVAIEDQRFYRHHGVDWYRTAGAFVNMFLGMKNTFGGSTITQQLIKNVTGENEATVNRKLIEIFRALEFEKLYDKKEIIEWYLNDVYFGHGQYGIGAAAQYYYGKEVTELTVAEMASIVGITNNPSLYSPYVSRERNKYRQETILGKMLEQGYLSEAEYQTAKAQELEFLPYKNPVTHATVYSYYVDTVISDVLKALMETQGISEKVASNLLYHGGVSVYCCMDPAIQAKVDSIYQNLDEIPLPSGSSQQLQSGIVIQDPFTGDIVAMAGGVGTEKVARGLNRASGSLARRPSGSSIKPISVYAPAMDAGLITPNTSFEDEAYVTLSGTSWMPKNDDNKYHGVVTLRTGIVHSYNTIAAQVLDKLTPQASYKFLTEMLNFTSLEPQDMDYAPLAVGQQSIGVTPREMAAGFSIFVNSGVYTEGRTFSTVCDSDGTVLVNNLPDSHPAISDTTAYWMTSILQDAVTYGTGKSAKLSAMPTAGKTGTSSNYKDRWFVGYTPYYTCAVWTGYDRPERIQISGNPAAVLWKKV
ncbi:MAG: transglycosylase domain-containing protein, partial [bacterium]